jgi:hypothetical protein
MWGMCVLGAMDRFCFMAKLQKVLAALAQSWLEITLRVK